MRALRTALTLIAAALPACTCSPLTPELKFACTTNADCADDFACRGGECRANSGGGGPCYSGETKSCPVEACRQVCGADGGYERCAPVSGGSFDVNPNHCGECGRACSTDGGLGCVNSRCTCTLDSDCPAGDVCNAAGVCTNSADSCAAVRCSPGEVCRQGICAGVPCVAGCVATESCDPGTNLCRPLPVCRLVVACDSGFCPGDPKPDGTACSDGVACTHTDVCSAGVCVGTTYSCGPPAVCQAAVICLGDGGCGVTPEPNGTACDDQQSCTAGDQCTAGVCAGTAYTCTAAACQASSVCAGDGGCVVTPAAVGAACDDGVACTAADQCGDGGVCSGTLYSCPLPTACQQAVACAGDGGCLITDKPNGTACDDGKACTSNDVCTNAVCDGTVGTTYQDLDGDGVGNSAVSSMVCPSPAGYVAVGGDCLDTDADVYRTVMAATDADQDGVTVATALAPACVGASSVVAGRTYYKNASGLFTWLGTASATADCNDADADVFTAMAAARDQDQDGVTATATTGSQCVGVGSTVSGRTYYADTAGAFSWLGAASSAADCLDTDADVFQNVSVIEDVDQDGFGAVTSSVALRCVGNTQAVAGRTYHRSATGAYTWLLGSQNLGQDCSDTNAATQGPSTYYADGDADGFGAGAPIIACTPPGGAVLNNTDCLEGNAFVHTQRVVFADGDQDGYTSGAAASQCTGSSSVVNTRTYFRNATGGYTWIATSLGADCDDASAAVTVAVDWFADGDSDGFGAGLPTTACSAPGGKPVSNGSDCNDADPDVFTNRLVYPDADQDGWTDAAQATQCTGSSTMANGRTYYRNALGAFTWIATSLGGDCATGNAALFQTVGNVVADDDRDGYPPSNAQFNVCAGAISVVGLRTYYAASAMANDYWMDRADCLYRMGSNCLAPFDCYDGNSSARPFQTAYFTSQRGDGSWDYDCSATVTSNSGVSTYCASPSSTTFYTDSVCTSGANAGSLCGATPASSYPAACGLFNVVTGPYYDNGGTCTAASRAGSTQIACH